MIVLFTLPRILLLVKFEERPLYFDKYNYTQIYEHILHRDRGDP